MSGRRVLALYGALLLGFAAVVCRLYWLCSNTEYAVRAAAQSEAVLRLPAARGNFYDCGGLPLTGISQRWLALTREADNGEKEVTKSLTFEKMSDGNCKVTNYSFRGYETDGAERMLRTGKSLIDSCFDSYIRRYCLFKGESQLNVFNEPTALKTLVDKFSDIRKFEDFVEVASDLEQKSETAYTKECKSDTKVAKRVGELQRRKEELEGKISELRRDIKKQEEVASTYQLKLDDLEKHQATSERYQEIKDRLKTKNEKLSRLKSLILVNYNAGLLDNF